MRGLLGELAVQPADVTILDMEASIEHMTRGTVRHVDTMIILVEPYFRALETAGRMAPLARDLGIPDVLAIANKIRTPADEVAISKYCETHGIEVIATVPFDESITEADLRGVALLDYAPDAPAVHALRTLARSLVKRAAAANGNGSGA
ncbi:MAG: hypothetical protein ABI939_05625 [Anaerolineaceae bacterium]